MFEQFNVWPEQFAEISALSGILSEINFPNKLEPAIEINPTTGLLVTVGELLPYVQVVVELPDSFIDPRFVEFEFVDLEALPEVYSHEIE